MADQGHIIGESKIERESMLEVHVCHGTFSGDIPELNFPFNAFVSEHQGDFPMHGHEYSELNLVLDGEAIHRTDFEDYKIERGDVFVINGHHRHGFEQAKNLRVVIVQYNPFFFFSDQDELEEMMGYHGLFDLETRTPKARKFRQRLKLFGKQLFKAESLGHALIEEFNRKEEGYKISIRGLFLQLTVKLCRSYAESHKEKNVTVVSMAQIMAYIRKHFHSNIRIEALAEIAKLSPSQMQRQFKTIYDTTPVHLINKLRVDKACQLLQQTQLELKDIASVVGYSTPSFFSAQFKQILGVTPREYRQKKTRRSSHQSTYPNFKSSLIMMKNSFSRLVQIDAETIKEILA